MTRPGLSWHMHSRLALHGVQAPRAARLLSRLLIALLVAAGLSLRWFSRLP